MVKLNELPNYKALCVREEGDLGTGFARMGSPSVSCQGLKTERDPQEEGVYPGLRGPRAAPPQLCPSWEPGQRCPVARAQRLPPGGLLEHLMGAVPFKPRGRLPEGGQGLLAEPPGSWEAGT